MTNDTTTIIVQTTTPIMHIEAKNIQYVYIRMVFVNGCFLEVSNGIMISALHTGHRPVCDAATLLSSHFVTHSKWKV